MEPLRFLLVEDNPGDAYLVQNMLGQLQDMVIQVTVVDRVASALEALRDNTYSLILLDLSLPDSHGLDTAVTVQKQSHTTPIVVLTGLSDQRVGIKAIRLGIQDYLNKNDLNVDVLARTVRYALERQRLLLEKERLIQDLDSFSHTVAHDLKNPLAIITGYASFLDNELESHPDKDLAKSMHQIVIHSQKMNSIINELLLLAHVRNREIETSPVDMRRVVDGAVRQLQPLLEKSKAVVKIMDDWPIADGYAPWLEEVWVNYISNAMKYGGSPPEITIGGETLADGRVRYWVEDNGRGLDNNDINALFKPFTRLDQIRVDGHGLGLSIVRRIITNLHGEIFVESQLDHGSRFGFTLPAAELDT